MESNQLQRNNFWNEARRYKFTSSSIYKLLTPSKSKEAKERGDISETARTYIIEKIAEELDGFIPDFVNDATAYGTEMETKARHWYDKLTGNKTIDVGFEKYNEFYGGSPDSKVVTPDGDNGALEIKCPYNSINHLRHCLINNVDYFKAKHNDYYWQCVSHMVTLGVNWCDFVSFDGRINHKIGFFIFRLERNEEDVKLLLKAVEKAQIEKQKIKAQLGL